MNLKLPPNSPPLVEVLFECLKRPLEFELLLLPNMLSEKSLFKTNFEKIICFIKSLKFQIILKRKNMTDFSARNSIETRKIGFF